MAVATYHDANGHYPPAFVLGPDGRPWHSWRVLILPYISEDKTYEAYKFDEPWDGPNNRQLADRMPRLFAFHAVRAEGNTRTNYFAVVGPETAWPGADKRTAADVKDGPERTIQFVENRGLSVHWTEPRDLSFAEMDFTVNSPAGVSSPYTEPAVAMLDGSVQRLRPHLSPASLRALLTVAGGEPLDDGPAGWELLPDGRDRPLREDGR